MAKTTIEVVIRHVTGKSLRVGDQIVIEPKVSGVSIYYLRKGKKLQFEGMPIGYSIPYGHEWPVFLATHIAALLGFAVQHVKQKDETIRTVMQFTEKIKYNH